MKNKSIYEISLPTGVKHIKKFISKKGTKKKFTEFKKGTPVHVKAVIKYNDLLNYFNCINNEQIKNSDKIKWIYLKQNPFNIDALAFKGYDDPQEILDFITEHIDYEKLYDRGLHKKIRMFYDALEWPLPIDKKDTLERFF